jgi:hypothetical protein
LLELGAAELRVAEPRAVDHLMEAVGLIREPWLLTVSVRQLALTLTMAGEADRAVEALESAIEVVEPADRERALVLEAELATYAQQASREARAPAARRLERHRHLEGATPGDRVMLASLAVERGRASRPPKRPGTASGRWRAAGCWARRSLTSPVSSMTS